MPMDDAVQPFADIDSAAAALLGHSSLSERVLTLDCDGCRLGLRSNSERLLERLTEYFAHVLSPSAVPDIEVIAIEREPVAPPAGFVDWHREPGKRGRKDAYLDIPGGRLVLKVRTGMLFLQSESRRIAAGACLEYDNQVINFINAQYMNWLQQRDWLICHAAGLVHNGVALGMAGLSGGGKSSLMLQLLDYADVDYLTNDRLFIRLEAGKVQARGIPKLPRINPGTIVTNPTLEWMIAQPRRRELLDLPRQELWELEDKYDVDVEGIYGAGRIATRAPLRGFLVLNWQPESARALTMQQVEPADRPDLLGAIMKSPGPFYQYADGGFFQDGTRPDARPYLELFENIPLFEVSGRIDFAGLKQRCYSELF